jgi:hypothetical protein
MACPFPPEGETSNASPSPVPNVAVAVLISQKNSHPFQKRTLSLHQPVKV